MNIIQPKHIVFSISVFMFIIMGIVGGILAYFTISAVSSNNSFTTGSLNLVLTDDNETQAVQVSDSWSAQDLLPGSQLPERKIEIFNASSVNADHIDIEFSYSGDEDIAKNFIFSSTNTGFRYGGSSDGASVNLNTTLRGSADTDYIVLQGTNGQPFTSTTVDGIDGTTPDSKISLSELAAFGKIRIKKGDERGGIDAGTAADLWLNAEISPNLQAQGANLDMQITFTLDQNDSQY